MTNKTIDMNAYMREYRIKNKEKYAEKILCEICGGSYTITNSSHHKHSDKHQFILLINKYNELQDKYNKLCKKLKQNE